MVHRPLVILASAALFTGCGPPGYDLWGVLHGDLTIREDRTVDGVFVWEFFDERWERRQSADDHRCGRVMSVQGVFDPSCSDCVYAALVTTDTVEHDCPGGEGVDPSLGGIDRIWLRASERVPPGTWPDDRWAWSLGWAGGAPEDEGLAWDEGMEFGEPPRDPGVVIGRRIRMTATNAHGFRGDRLVSQVQNSLSEE
jgi:hypothetical protein